MIDTIINSKAIDQTIFASTIYKKKHIFTGVELVAATVLPYSCRHAAVTHCIATPLLMHKSYHNLELSYRYCLGLCWLWYSSVIKHDLRSAYTTTFAVTPVWPDRSHYVPFYGRRVATSGRYMAPLS